MKRASRKPFVLLGLVIGLLMLVIFGCGAPPSSPSTSESTPESQESQTSKDEIPIGELTSYTGEMGAYGINWFNAAKLAVAEINATGGVLGRPIKLYTEDDQGNVEEGIRGARKLINTQKVVAIHGMISEVFVAIMDIGKDNKVMISSQSAGTTKLDNMGGEYSFRTCPSDSFDGKVAARMLWDKGYKEIGLMMENDDGRQSIAKAVKDEYTRLGGKIIVEVTFNPRQTTYKAELKKVFDAKPPLVWLGAGQESGPSILKEWSQRGYGGKWMVNCEMVVPETFDLVDKNVMEGIIGEYPSSPTDTPEHKAFAEKWEKAYGEVPSGGFVENAYDAYMILALAMTAGGEATGEAISKNYQKVANPPGVVVNTYEQGVAELKKGNDINFEGVSGPCDFDQYGSTVGGALEVIAKDGKWEEVKYWAPSTFQ